MFRNSSWPGVVPAIYVLAAMKKDVDARDKRGHDGKYETYAKPSRRAR